MITRHVTIINKYGLHARAAAKFVSTAAAFSSSINVGNGERTVDGKSIMSVMMLAASKGTEICLQIDGTDEAEAMEAITDLIDKRFDEPE